MKNIKLILLTLVVFWAGVVHAENWTNISYKENFVLEYDKSRLSKEFGITTIWLRYLYNPPEIANGVKITKFIQKAQLDCKKQKIAFLSGYAYFETSLISGGENTRLEWNDVIPDSNGEAIYSIACN